MNIITPAALPAILVAREQHIAEFFVEPQPRPYVPGTALVVRDAIEHGWGGASAEVAERLRALVDEAREAVVVKHMPFPILPRLEALVDELESAIGR